MAAVSSTEDRRQVGPYSEAAPRSSDGLKGSESRATHDGSSGNSAESEYKNLGARFLRPDERNIAAADMLGPLVFEPTSKDTSVRAHGEAALRNADQIERDLARHGAVLFRGFDVGT